MCLWLLGRQMINWINIEDQVPEEEHFTLKEQVFGQAFIMVGMKIIPIEIIILLEAI